MNIYKAQIKDNTKEVEGQLFIETNGKHYIKCVDPIMAEAFLNTYEVDPATLKIIKYEMTDLEKRLIALSHLGITIQHMNGHRYINCHETEEFNFDRILNLNGISLNNKIYGTLEETLYIIDKCLILCNCKTLLESFWMDEEDIKLKKNTPYDDSRINIVERGKGGLV